MNKEQLTYKDEETGHILFGQEMLDRHTEQLRLNTESNNKIIQRQDVHAKWLKGLVVIFTIWTLIGIWLIWYTLKTGAVNNALAAIGGC